MIPLCPETRHPCPRNSLSLSLPLSVSIFCSPLPLFHFPPSHIDIQIYIYTYIDATFWMQRLGYNFPEPSFTPLHNLNPSFNPANISLYSGIFLTLFSHFPVTFPPPPLPFLTTLLLQHTIMIFVPLISSKPYPLPPFLSFSSWLIKDPLLHKSDISRDCIDDFCVLHSYNFVHCVYT